MTDDYVSRYLQIELDRCELLAMLAYLSGYCKNEIAAMIATYADGHDGHVPSVLTRDAARGQQYATDLLSKL